MKIKMPTVNSNVKLITSNQAPTTSNLAKGEMAFGQVAGINSIYGNTGNGIIKIEFTASGEPIIYFANEEALNSFVEGDDVPASGWYAAIADDLYRFNLKELNGDLVPEWVNSIESGDRTNGWSDVTHKGWWLTVIAHDTYGHGTQTTSTMILGEDFNCQGKATAIDGTDLVVIKSSCPTLTDSSINSGSGGYMIVTLPVADGYEFVSGYATNSYEPYEPEPTKSYVQFDLSSTLGSGINSVEFSNMASSGTLNTPVSLSGSYNIQIGPPISGASKVTIDASIPFFGTPDYNFPDMDVQWHDTTAGGGGYSGSKTIAPEYDSSAKVVRWQGSFTTDGTSTQSTARAIFGQYLMYINVTNYYEGDSPQLTGTIKIEDA